MDETAFESIDTFILNLLTKEFAQFAADKELPDVGTESVWRLPSI